LLLPLANGRAPLFNRAHGTSVHAQPSSSRQQSSTLFSWRPYKTLAVRNDACGKLQITNFKSQFSVDFRGTSGETLNANQARPRYTAQHPRL
jgi:hypothetical protein